MIVLDSSDTLQVLLAGAITTNQGVLYAAYADLADDASVYVSGNNSAPTNSTTAVTWVASPAAVTKRQVKYLSLYNADTVSMTATIRVVDNATNRILLVVALAAGERVEYTDTVGFRVIDATGALRAGSVSSVNGATGAVVLTISGLASVQTVTSAGTVTPAATNDKVVISAQAAALTIANPSGTAAEGQGFVIALKDNATARAITWGANYRAMGAALPTTTTISKWMYIPVIRNHTDSKWDVLSVSQEA